MDENLPYFAYGSNLNMDDLRSWCRRNGVEYPFYEPLGRAFLPDWEPVFNFHSPMREGGALNIAERVGQLTPGALFRVRPGNSSGAEGWAVLDRKEGAPHVYSRRRLFVLTEDGEQQEAVTYEVVPERREEGLVPPSGEYVAAVREGYGAFDLPDEGLDAAAEGLRLPFFADCVFCYGTLMHGESRHNLLDPAGNIRSVRPGRAAGELYDLGNFPGMRQPREPDRRVLGELLQMRDVGWALRRLDLTENFEGFGVKGSMYRRALIRVETEGGQPERAWTYLLNRKPGGPCIESGNWRDRPAGSTEV